LKSVAGTKSY